MSKPKVALALVNTAPPVPAPKSKRKPRSFMIPLLTEMTPEEQQAFVLEAHDAILALQLPKAQMTVKEALLTLASGVDRPYRTPAYWIEHDLRMLRVQVAPQVHLHQCTTIDEYTSKNRALYSPQGLAVAGESAKPIGYVIGYAEDYPSAKALAKPLKKYYDVLASCNGFVGIGFPLYHTSYRHLVDVACVLENYRPWLAEGERDRRAAKVAREQVEELSAESPEAVARRAHKAILERPLGRELSVRQALVLARTPVAPAGEDESIHDYIQRFREQQIYQFILSDCGIQALPEGAPCAGIVVHPGKLTSKGLQQYRKMLGGTEEGAREVCFQLFL